MILTSAVFPCKGCKKRHVGCHSRCEEYLALKAAAAAEHKERLKTLLVTMNPAKEKRHTKYIRDHGGTR